jgi:hypothetical protein
LVSDSGRGLVEDEIESSDSDDRIKYQYIEACRLPGSLPCQELADLRRMENGRGRPFAACGDFLAH